MKRLTKEQFATSRPPTYRKVSLSAQVQVKLTPDLRDAIEHAAARENKTMSDWVRDLIIEAIETRRDPS